VAELEAGLTDYFWFYNRERPHQALGYQAPAEVYFSTLEAQSASIRNQSKGFSLTYFARIVVLTLGSTLVPERPRA